MLRAYRNSVGEAEFRRVYGEYMKARFVDEVEHGAHRLVIWELPGTGGELAGQYLVEVGGRFVVDDTPSEARSKLRGVLQSYREKARPSRRKD